MRESFQDNPRTERRRGFGLIRWLAGLALFAVWAGAADGADDAETLRSGCELDYPPFCIVHEDGRADGFSVELLRAALAKMDREVTFRTGPWSEVRGWLERGEIDCLPLVGRTPEREALFDFTVPYLTMHGAIVVRKGSEGIHALADLRGQRVGVMKGDNAEEFLRRKDRGFEIVTTPTFSDALRALSESRCDAVVMQRLVALRLLDDVGLDNLTIVDRPIRDFAQDWCFAVQEGDRETLALLNEGLALVVADGTRRRLHAKWFASLELPSDRPIVIGGDHNYPPFEFLDKKGRPAGFTVELTRAIAREMNMDVRFRLGPWADTVQALREGRIDAIQGMFYSPQRDVDLNFTPRYLVIHCVSVVRKDGGRPPVTFEELAGRDLVVQAEDAILDAMAERGIEARITTVATQSDVVRAVAEGRHACGLATRHGALHAIRKHGWTDLDLGDEAIYSGQYGYAVPHGSDALLAQFTEGLRVLKDSGEYQRLYEKWMGVYGDHYLWHDVLKVVALVAGPMLLVALLALAWNWLLRRQVAKQTSELREKETFIRAVLDNLPVGVAVNSVAPGVTFEYMNDLFPKIYRTTYEALSTPDAFWEVVYTDPQFREELRSRVESDCASGDPERMVWTDVPIMRPGEPTTYITARNTPIPGMDLMISSVWDVTERKRAEEELARQYRLLKVAGETTRFGGWSVDLATNICTWSDTVADIHGMPHGFSPKAEEGMAFYAPEWRERIKQVFTACAEEGIPYDEEMEILTRSGERVWVRTAGEAIRDKDGRIVQVQGSFQDISRQKRQQVRIEHLNRVLRAIRDVNQLITHEDDRNALLRKSCEILISTRGYRSAWVALRDSDGNLESVSESGIGEDFAVVRAAMEQGDWPECCRQVAEQPDGIAVMHDTDRNCKTCPLSHSYRDTAALAGALRHGGRDHGVLVVALPAGMADDADEQSLFRELVGDVAYALHAMEATQRRHREEAKFRSYVENAPYGIFIADRAGRYLDVNPAASDITGYSRDELLSMSISDLVPPNGKEEAQRHFQMLVEHGRSDGEIDFLRKDGAVRRWHVLAVALESDRFLGFVEDVTERNLAEREHEKLQSQLQQAQKMESVGRLAGGVAHDFNNMIMGIMNYAELCRDRIEEDHPIREWLNEITHEAERSANLTRQLLAFARKQTVAPQIVDLNDAVGRMLKMLRRLIGEDINLAWEPCEDVWPVKVDPGQIDQILANLCVNARDAIAGVGKVTIETGNVTFDASYCAAHAGFKPGEFAMLAVSDDGCGMDRETLNNVFEPFFTTKPTGEGTGLGLATVYGIVKQNDGFINAYSEPGEGTTFKIYLPRFAGEEEAPRKADQAPERIGGSETILLVEDEKSIRMTMRLFLEDLGYTVLTAESPEVALAIAAEHPDSIDLLITDVVMPGMNGRDLAGKLAQDFPSMKVLYMSGYTANVIAHRGILEKDVHFMNKPVGRDELARKVREVLG